MTRAIKIGFMAAAIGGFSVGAAYGCYRAQELSAIMESTAAISASREVANFVRQQFEHADPVHARQAVLLEIRMLEQLERSAHNSETEGQLGLAYTRLAIIEESAGKADTEHYALEQARAWFSSLHPQQQRTDEQMKNTLRQLDGAADKL